MAAGEVIARDMEGLPYFVLKLLPNQRLIYARRCKIHNFTYQHCDKCGFDWQGMEGHEEGEDTEIGLHIYSNHIIQNVNGKTFALLVCPRCGSYDSLLCPTCGTPVNKMGRPNTKPQEIYYECPKCKVEVPWHVQLLDGELRQAIYMLGYQTTTPDGKNVKCIQFIKEDGSYELNADYDYNAMAK
jgi:hypothetical protein